eukprot:5859937-Alexandrium_andersonii.AAC.1
MVLTPPEPFTFADKPRAKTRNIVKKTKKTKKKTKKAKAKASAKAGKSASFKVPKKKRKRPQEAQCSENAESNLWSETFEQRNSSEGGHGWDTSEHAALGGTGAASDTCSSEGPLAKYFGYDLELLQIPSEARPTWVGLGKC